MVIEDWRREYNTKRPPSALKYRPPAPETYVPRFGRFTNWLDCNLKTGTMNGAGQK